VDSGTKKAKNKKLIEDGVRDGRTRRLGNRGRGGPGIDRTKTNESCKIQQRVLYRLKQKQDAFFSANGVVYFLFSVLLRINCRTNRLYRRMSLKFDVTINREKSGGRRSLKEELN
jgi:hypothetical protein